MSCDAPVQPGVRTWGFDHRSGKVTLRKGGHNAGEREGTRTESQLKCLPPNHLEWGSPRPASYANHWAQELASLMSGILGSAFGPRYKATYCHSHIGNMADNVTSIYVLHVSISQLALNLSKMRSVLCMDPTKLVKMQIPGSLLEIC